MLDFFLNEMIVFQRTLGLVHLLKIKKKLLFLLHKLLLFYMALPKQNKKRKTKKIM